MKRSDFEKDFAKMRDEILFFSITSDLSNAHYILQQAEVFINEAKIGRNELREAKCRLMESELHIADNEVDSFSNILKCLLKINSAPEFDEDRRKVVIELGINMLLQNR